MERALAWIAPVLALTAVLFLPALRAAAPFTPQAEWTIGQLASELASGAASSPASKRRANPNAPDLRQLLQNARQLGREFGLGSGQRTSAASGHLEAALAFAASIPAAALLAGLSAVFCLLFTAPTKGALWRRLRAAAAAIGLLACGYAIAASWWLTRTAQAAARDLVSGMQDRLGGLLGGLHISGVGAGAVSALGLWPEAGLYVLLLAFAAILFLPAPRSA